LSAAGAVDWEAARCICNAPEDASTGSFHRLEPFNDDMNLGKAIASELVPTVGRLIGRVERLLFQALLAETSL
jgi:hypothetical protein